MEELLKIKDHIESVRAKINENLGTPNNLNGCLKGDCDGFVQVYDAQIEQFKKRIAESRAYW